ncbi:MAG: DNA polymerase domain-containing protein [Candidatus Bathyarchaeia archaeon]
MKEWRSDFTRPKLLRGWLLDLYPSGLGEMTVWIITENGERVRLVDGFQPRIYVSGKIADLSKLTDHFATSKSVAKWRYTEKYADFMEDKKSKVLEITTTDCRRIPYFARKLLRLGGYEKFRLHNVDLPHVQTYLYDRNVFPLAFLDIVLEGDRIAYCLLDSVESVDYEIPPLRLMSIRIEVEDDGVIPRFEDPVKSVTLESDGKSIVIDEGDESEKILRMVEVVKDEDPDIIFTPGGDSFLFPYLAHRAFVNGILNRLVLGREDVPLKAKKRRGTTFFSYGRVYFKAPMRRLYGRIHIDKKNTFIYSACGLDGLIEVSRTCRVPLHRAARASIGTIMSSLQLYQATKDDILIPWKKRAPETFKSAWELLVADRGGFVFEPRLGIHDGVAEVDFSSMYPTLMAKRNISAETVLCKCCPDSKLRVPELGYNVCEKRQGIVPKTLKTILKKRATYKRMRSEARESEVKRIYDRRQNALKWILVTCFGYLGYKNARFGKVDAHIAICAFAREALLKTVRMAEERGFEIVHGIVDSLWLKKEGASPREYVTLCRDVSKEIGVQLNVEGRYRWIVFLPSRMHPGVPVLNRYYGVFESGKIKVRGIEAVRRDTPRFIRDAQMDMIKSLAKASSSEGFRKKIRDSVDVLRGYVAKLMTGDVDLHDLVIAKRLSMHPDRYAHDVFQAIAAKQLIEADVEVSGGQTVSYVITDAENRRLSKRVKAAELIDDDTEFDVEKYVDMLIQAGANILSPFGYSDERLKDEIVYGAKQTVLKPLERTDPMYAW